MQYWRGVQAAKKAAAEGTERNAERAKGGRKPELAPIDQLLFTMIQLRAVPFHGTCCALFGIAEQTGTVYYTTWLLLMQDFLLAAHKVDQPLVDKLTKMMPPQFKELFGGRPVIMTIDCMHREMQSPSDSYARKAVYSSYWGSCAGKVLIPLSVLGANLPPSKTYPAHITDPQITEAWFKELIGDAPIGDFSVEELKLLKSFLAGIWILADKGWVDYSQATRQRGIFFVTPDKSRDGAEQFTADETFWNADVAHLRIHVERAIKRIEFRVFNVRATIHRKDLMSAEAVCSLLCNFLPPGRV